MNLLGLLSREGRAVRHLKEDRAEKLLADSFRLLSKACSQLADYIEAERLKKAGYQRPDKFLERTDGGDLEGRSK
jgi:hypothetical protein